MRQIFYKYYEGKKINKNTRLTKKMSKLALNLKKRQTGEKMYLVLIK